MQLQIPRRMLVASSLGMTTVSLAEAEAKRETKWLLTKRRRRPSKPV